MICYKRSYTLFKFTYKSINTFKIIIKLSTKNINYDKTDFN